MKINERFFGTLTSKQTVSAYRRDLQLFTAWYGDDEDAVFSPALLLDYIDFLKEEHSASSINRYLSSLRTYVRWAALVGTVDPSVYAAAKVIPSLKTPSKLPQPLQPEEIERISASFNLSSVWGARDNAFFQVALSTGARIAEIIALNIEQVRFTQALVIVTGKGQKEREVYLDEVALSALVYYLGLRGNPQSGALFINADGNRLSHRWCQKTLAELGKKLGIELHPHKLRRTFAVAALNATGDIHTVSQFLGHANVATTQLYTRMATDNQRRVARQVAAYRGRASQEIQEVITAKGVAQPVVPAYSFVG